MTSRDGIWFVKVGTTKAGPCVRCGTFIPVGDEVRIESPACYTPVYRMTATVKVTAGGKTRYANAHALCVTAAPNA